MNQLKLVLVLEHISEMYFCKLQHVATAFLTVGWGKLDSKQTSFGPYLWTAPFVQCPFAVFWSKICRHWQLWELVGSLVEPRLPAGPWSKCWPSRNWQNLCGAMERMGDSAGDEDVRHVRQVRHVHEDSIIWFIWCWQTHCRHKPKQV